MTAANFLQADQDLHDRRRARFADKELGTAAAGAGWLLIALGFLFLGLALAVGLAV
jgi:hypothetical protein